MKRTSVIFFQKMFSEQCGNIFESEKSSDNGIM